jgi:hypothetical protein
MPVRTAAIGAVTVTTSPVAQIEEVLNGDEHVLWTGRPAVLPFFAGSLLRMLLGIPLVVATLRFVGTNPSAPSGHAFAILFLGPFLFLAFVLVIAYPLYRLLVYVNLSYAITNKRILLKSGIIAKEVLMLDFDQVSNASVVIDFLDVFVGFGQSGSVVLTTRGSPGPEESSGSPGTYVLSHIPHPYNVFKFFQRAEYDVKTDMEYPNGLRPEMNPGYPTSYTPPGAP